MARLSHIVSTMNRMLRLMGLWGAAALVTGIAVGCSNVEDDGDVSDDELHSAARTANNLLTNEELMGKPGARTVVPTEAQIQKFLEKTPHKGVRSVLADKQVLLDDGTEAPETVPASKAIYNAAKAGGINPLELIVRLQLEQSLIGTKAGQLSDAELDRRLKIAFGCGCPHAPVCKTQPEKYTGFYQQLSCAVRVIKGHMSDVTTKKKTSSGWGPGIPMTTSDGAEITPENEATAVLYTYTPYAGQDFGGQKSAACKNAAGQNDYCAGAALHTWLWDSYASAISGTTPAQASVDSGADATVTAIVDAGPAPTPTPDVYVPPTPGECTAGGSECVGNSHGEACLDDNTCGCAYDSDCTGYNQECNTATSQCRTKQSTTPTPTPTPTSTGTTPRPPTPPLYDAGVPSSTETAAATPPPTAPRAADDPSQRPTPGATGGGLGYNTGNPYGEGTSSAADGGTGKKKNSAQKASGGCSVGAAGTGSPAELPSTFFLVAGVATILAGRRKKA